MRIVFMGTPVFAVPSLQTLLNSRHDVVGVVTVPDKPAGRGRQMRMSAVKTVAREHDLPVLQPQDLNALDFLAEVESLQADLFVVVAFRILPEAVFTMPPKGTFNLHASLLPKFRGAAPINWALIKGESQTGVTTFFLDKGVDTGNLLLQRKIGVSPDVTAGELHDELKELGAEVVLETVNGIDDGGLQPQPQVGEVTKAPKLTKELAEIDWSQSAVDLNNLIRGLSPFPGAVCQFRDKSLKILRAHVADEHTDAAPGVIVSTEKNTSLIVATGAGGALAIDEVKPEGKRAMTASEFIRGYHPESGDQLG